MILVIFQDIAIFFNSNFKVSSGRKLLIGINISGTNQAMDHFYCRQRGGWHKKAHEVEAQTEYEDEQQSKRIFQLSNRHVAAPDLPSLCKDKAKD
jgi:hypothetical protein